jgi:hypothetical protein
MQQQKLNETVFEDEALAEQINNSEQGSQSSIVSDKGSSDDEDCNKCVIESGCESEDEDDGLKTKFSTFKTSNNMRDYKWE